MLSFVAQKLVMFDYITKGEDSHCFGVNYYTHIHTPTHTNTHTCEKFLGWLSVLQYTRGRERCNGLSPPIEKPTIESFSFSIGVFLCHCFNTRKSKWQLYSKRLNCNNFWELPLSPLTKTTIKRFFIWIRLCAYKIKKGDNFDIFEQKR